MLISILTLFPDFFDSSLKSSILARAQKSNQVEISVVNIRDFALDKHATTDDRPFGGGPGMVMLVEPIDKALQTIKKNQPDLKLKTILTSAKGNLFTQSKARSYSELDHLIIICGHYEGVDERVAAHLVDEELRIGNYVLTGGEPAAVVITDAVTRLIPGVLGNEASNQGESHQTEGVMAFPQYSKPREYRGWQVPKVLTEGDHQAILEWRESKRLIASQDQK